jgi:hypothetical protein
MGWKQGENAKKHCKAKLFLFSNHLFSLIKVTNPDLVLRDPFGMNQQPTQEGIVLLQIPYMCHEPKSVVSSWWRTFSS